jgi:hypothetical protein
MIHPSDFSASLMIVTDQGKAFKDLSPINIDSF